MSNFLQFSPPYPRPHIHFIESCIYASSHGKIMLRDRSGTTFVKICAMGHTLPTGIKLIFPYFSSVLDTIWQGPRKNIEWLWLSSNSMHVILSRICDLRRKKGRTFYRCQSNHIFARTDTPPGRSISGEGGATAVTERWMVTTVFNIIV
jgi:hypothetical protein